jgi:hypothetical protein
MTKEEKNNYETRIIILEYEITSAIINGHKPHPNDNFEEKRRELVLLRCCVFGFNNPCCKKHFHGDE